MVKLKVVTGYVPIRDHPRGPEEYGALGEKLREIDAPIQPFYELLGTCWMTHCIAALPYVPTHSTADNPQKNTLAYHVVQHQKFEWLYQASRRYKDADVFVWIDYGIMHVPGVTPQVINDFLGRIRKNDLAIPGCWGRGHVDDSVPNWRFCGGVMVVPRKRVQLLKNLIQSMVIVNLVQTHNITWEVNMLAHAEASGRINIRWYKADHNQTLFEGY